MSHDPQTVFCHENDNATSSSENTFQSMVFERIGNLERKMDILNEHQAVLGNAIHKCMDVLLNLEKIFKEQLPEDNQKEDLCQISEDFSSIESRAHMKTPEELISFEQALTDETFQAKMLRFYCKIKKLNGKAEGNVIMRDFLRLFIEPIDLKTYSWKGQSASKDGVRHQLLSFKSCFPNFINCANKIACAADNTFTREDSEKAISEFLRLKYCNEKRDSIRRNERRTGSKRNYKGRRTTSGIINEIYEIDQEINLVLEGDALQ